MNGHYNDPYVRPESGPDLVNRSPGLDAKDHSPPPHEADQENMAMLNRGIEMAPIGDPCEHLSRHARFALTPLGQAMPSWARERLVEHMRAHVQVLFPVAARGNQDMHEAGNLAMMLGEMKHA